MKKKRFKKLKKFLAWTLILVIVSTAVWFLAPQPEPEIISGAGWLQILVVKFLALLDKLLALMPAPAPSPAPTPSPEPEIKPDIQHQILPVLSSIDWNLIFGIAGAIFALIILFLLIFRRERVNWVKIVGWLLLIWSVYACYCYYIIGLWHDPLPVIKQANPNYDTNFFGTLREILIFASIICFVIHKRDKKIIYYRKKLPRFVGAISVRLFGATIIIFSFWLDVFVRNNDVFTRVELPSWKYQYVVWFFHAPQINFVVLTFMIIWGFIKWMRKVGWIR